MSNVDSPKVPCRVPHEVVCVPELHYFSYRHSQFSIVPSRCSSSPLSRRVLQVFPNPYDVVPQSDVEVSLVSVSPTLPYVRSLWLFRPLQLPVCVIFIELVKCHRRKHTNSPPHEAALSPTRVLR